MFHGSSTAGTTHDAVRARVADRTQPWYRKPAPSELPMHRPLHTPATATHSTTPPGISSRHWRMRWPACSSGISRVSPPFLATRAADAATTAWPGRARRSMPSPWSYSPSPKTPRSTSHPGPLSQRLSSPIRPSASAPSNSDFVPKSTLSTGPEITVPAPSRPRKKTSSPPRPPQHSHQAWFTEGRCTEGRCT